MDALRENCVLPFMPFNSDIFTFPQKPLEPPSDHLVFQLLCGEPLPLKLLPNPLCVTHAGIESYKLSCKRQYQRKIVSVAHDKVRKEILKVSTVKTPKTTGVVQPRKWMDPKRIKKKEAAVQRMRTQHNKNRRKPKNPEKKAIAHADLTILGDDGLIGKFIDRVFGGQTTQNILGQVSSDQFDSFCARVGTSCVPLMKVTSQLSQYYNHDKCRKMLTIITRFWFVVDLIPKQPDYVSAWKVIYLWLNTDEFNLIGSLIMNVFKVIKRTIPDTSSRKAVKQSGDEAVFEADESGSSLFKACERRDIIPMEFLRSFMGNWSSLRHNPLFKHLREIFLASIALKLFSVADLPKCGQTLAETMFPVINTKTHSATSLVDAVLKSIIIIGENLNKCVRDRSILPLFGTSRNMKRLEARFRTVHEIDCCVSYNIGTVKQYGFTDDTFKEYVRTLREDLTYYSLDLKDGFATTRIDRMIKELTEIGARFVSKHWRGKARIAPFTIGMYGGTSVGKSVLSQQILRWLLDCNGIPATSATAIARIDLADKYESNLQTDTVGVIIDDVANTIADRNNGIAVTERILRYVNNMPATAVKADLRDKDTVPIRPHAVIMSSNLSDFGARSYSVEPLSIVRRCNVCLQVAVKPEFQTSDGMLDSSKLQAYDKESWIPAWNFTVYKFCYKSAQDKNLTPINDLTHTSSDGRTFSLTNMGWVDLFTYLIDVTRSHYKNQERVVSEGPRMEKLTKSCKGCRFPLNMCRDRPECRDDEPIEDTNSLPYTCSSSSSQDSLSLAPSMTDSSVSAHVDIAVTEDTSSSSDLSTDCFESVDTTPPSKPIAYPHASNGVVTFWDRVKSCFRKYRLLTNHIEYSEDDRRIENGDDSAIAYFDELQETNTFFRLASWLPDSPWVAKKVTWFVQTPFAQFIARGVPTMRRYTMCSALAVTGFAIGYTIVAIPVTVCAAFGFGSEVAIAKYRQLRINAQVFGTKVLSSYAFKYLSLNWLEVTQWSSVTVAALFIISNLIKRVRHVKKNLPHGNLLPRHVDDVKLRDDEVNQWAKVHTARSKHIPTVNMTEDDFNRIIHDNTRLVIFRDIALKGKNPLCHCLMLRGNVGVIPAHAVEHFSDGTVDVRCAAPGTTLGNVECVLNRDMIYPLPGTDLAFIYLNRVNQARDITCLFYDDVCPSGVGAILSVSKIMEPTLWGCNIISYATDLSCEGTVCKSFEGYRSLLHGAKRSYNGLCGAPLVVYGGSMSIIGIHLGAIVDHVYTYKECLAGRLTQDMITTGLNQLVQHPLVHLHADWGEIPDQLYGEPVITSTDVHRKSAVAHQPAEDNSISVLHLGQGSFPKKYTSKCVQTPISSEVRALFNIETCWDGPQFSKPWVFNRDYLIHSSKCSMGLPCPHVSFAYSDYTTQLFDNIDQSFFQAARPLTDIQNVNGIPQCRFIDALNMSTSVGYPINRPKTEFLLQVDEEEIAYRHYQHPRKLDSKFFAEVNKCDEILSRNERIMSIFYASLKDEPTKTTKTKVRVFQAAPIALSLLVRRYFLPIARILSCNPLISECAVGISAEGPEWYEWDKHVFRFGNKRVLAGDYSRYDLCMPAQLSTMALGIMIDCAKKSPNYTARDLRVMNALVTELCFPIVHLNGDIVCLLGSNPSGHNLTVYVNSIVNSIIFRCAYYDSQRCRNITTLRPFDKVCSSSTYGDDVIATVSGSLGTTFTFDSVKQFLARYDIVFTTPDKSDREGIHFFDKNDVDFLKRRTVFVPELYLPVGALDEMSILKSLCCIVQGHESISAVTQSNLTLAARTYVYHGRAKFDKIIVKLRLLAENQGWDCTLLNLNLSFDEWILKHLISHRKEYLSLHVTETTTGVFAGSLGDSWKKKLLQKYPNFLNPVFVEAKDFMSERLIFEISSPTSSTTIKRQLDAQITEELSGAVPINVFEHASGTGF